MAKPTQRCSGIFAVDVTVPPDHRGRRACICGLIGHPGDAHHSPPEPPEEPDHGQRAAGEGSEG